MSLKCLLLVCLLWSINARLVFAQSKTTYPEKVFDRVEQMPEYPGGNSALLTYFARNLRIPAECNNSLDSKILVEFVVTRTGEIRNVVVKKTVCSHPKATEAIEVLMYSMPCWKPGKQKGTSVNVRYSLPVTVCLMSQ
jgi:protein TonB